MGAGSVLPYLYGALGGLGILLLFFGLGRAADASREELVRRSGLRLITAGLFCIAASAGLIMWAT